MIFLDNHTKTRPSKTLIDHMAHAEKDHWLFNPEEKTKKELLESFNMEGAHVWLTASRAEANFQVLLSHYIDHIRECGRTHILSLETEDTSILKGIERLEKFEVQGKILPVNAQGQLTKKALAEDFRARSSMLSLSLAHPLTGVIQPIHDLIQACVEQDVRVHLDLSAALGKMYLQVEDADFLTFDGSLIHCPGNVGGLIVKEGISFVPTYFGNKTQFASLSSLNEAVHLALETIDHYSMEVGRLRDLFERKVAQLGGTLFFQEVERLSNTSVIAFEGVHAEQLLEQLKKQGIIATTGQGELPRMLKACHVEPTLAHCGLSFVLSDETTQQEIERVVETLASVIQELLKFPKPFTEEGAKAKQMRLCKGTAGAKEIGNFLELSLLVDEEDGVIADAQVASFGSCLLHEVAEAMCKALLRRNYLQARRITADLIEKSINRKENLDVELNLSIDAIDSATEECMDIPIEDVYVAPPEMEGGERSVYPNWETLSNDHKKQVISDVVEKEIAPYVELDAGGVEVVNVEENRVTIAYSGNCTSCFSATGATLDAIGNILRHRIYPDLMVIPDMTLLSQ